jgi:hypothetical protein
MDRDGMSNHYRGPSIDASYQVSVHLAEDLGKWFQRRFFRNQPIRNKNGLWQPCLLLYHQKNELDFLAHLAKGKVSFCHHLASVVCRPLTFHILIFSSETPLAK